MLPTLNVQVSLLLQCTCILCTALSVRKLNRWGILIQIRIQRKQPFKYQKYRATGVYYLFDVRG